MNEQAIAPTLAAIWYSPFTDEWWMEPDDRAIQRFWLESHPDAINVTNAYDVLAPSFITQLRQEAACGHALAACGRCGRTLVVAINPAMRVEFYYCPPGRCR